MDREPGGVKVAAKREVGGRPVRLRGTVVGSELPSSFILEANFLAFCGLVVDAAGGNDCIA